MSKTSLKVVEGSADHEARMEELYRRSQERAKELRDREKPSEEGHHTAEAAMALMDVGQNWSRRWRQGKPANVTPSFNDFEREI